MKINNKIKWKTMKCIYRWNRQSAFRRLLGDVKAVLSDIKYRKLL